MCAFHFAWRQFQYFQWTQLGTGSKETGRVICARLLAGARALDAAWETAYTETDRVTGKLCKTYALERFQMVSAREILDFTASSFWSCQSIFEPQTLNRFESFLLLVLMRRRIHFFFCPFRLPEWGNYHCSWPRYLHHRQIYGTFETLCFLDGWVWPVSCLRDPTRSFQDTGVEKAMPGNHHGKHWGFMASSRVTGVVTALSTAGTHNRITSKHPICRRIHF